MIFIIAIVKILFKKCEQGFSGHQNKLPFQYVCDCAPLVTLCLVTDEHLWCFCFTLGGGELARDIISICDCGLALKYSFLCSGGFKITVKHGLWITQF